MKHIAFIVVASLTLISCVNELEVDCNLEQATPMDLTDELNLTDGVIIGEKLRNPYTIEVMKEACDMLYPPTRGEDPVSDSLIVPNVKYVRFLPTDSVEYRLLMDSDLELFNYPLDYDILGDPSDYHDPNLPPEQITWQYTVMPIEQTPPINRVETLGVGFVPNKTQLGGDYDLLAIEKTANGIVLNELTTNLSSGSGIDAPKPPTTTTSSYTGKICVCDTGESNAKGVKGVKVRARHFWKIRTAYTQEDGTYYIDMKDFEDVNPRFELRFENRYGFKLGYGIELIMPQTYNMGSTRIYTFEDSDTGKDFKAWVLSTINNAAYDWYKRCKKEGMPTPPSDLYVWAMEMGKGASCMMLHHGTLEESKEDLMIMWGYQNGEGFLPDVVNILSAIVDIIGPDVTVCNVDKLTTSNLYQHTCHELAHATHFQQVGDNDQERARWWSYVFNYEATCIALSSGAKTYEYPGLPYEERAGITEMWAHAVGHICEFEYYSKLKGDYNSGYWFMPEIIWELYKAGMTLKQINQSMTEDIVLLDDFKDQLIKDNRTYESLIEEQFAKLKL